MVTNHHTKSKRSLPLLKKKFELPYYPVTTQWGLKEDYKLPLKNNWIECRFSRTNDVNRYLVAPGSEVVGDADRRVHLGSRVLVSSPDLVNQASPMTLVACLGITKHSFICQLATASHCMCQIRYNPVSKILGIHVNYTMEREWDCYCWWATSYGNYGGGNKGCFAQELRTLP